MNKKRKIFLIAAFAFFGILFFAVIVFPKTSRLALLCSVEQQEQIAFEYDYYRNNQKIAAKWYLLAAESGGKTAQSALSAMYASGDALRQDWAESFFWGCVLVGCWNANYPRRLDGMVFKGSLPRGTNHNPLEGQAHLTEQEITEQKQRASKWVPGNITVENLPQIYEGADRCLTIAGK